MLSISMADLGEGYYKSGSADYLYLRAETVRQIHGYFSVMVRALSKNNY